MAWVPYKLKGTMWHLGRQRPQVDSRTVGGSESPRASLQAAGISSHQQVSGLRKAIYLNI